MGAAFLAEQGHPVKRQVALKVIQPGMDAKPLVRRFEAERQALEMMDRPNVEGLRCPLDRLSRRHFVIERSFSRHLRAVIGRPIEA